MALSGYSTLKKKHLHEVKGPLRRISKGPCEEGKRKHEGKSLIAQSAANTCRMTALVCLRGSSLISLCFIVNELHAVVCLYNQGEGAELLAKVPKIS